jgi:hypothetical protein
MHDCLWMEAVEVFVLSTSSSFNAPYKRPLTVLLFVDVNLRNGKLASACVRRRARTHTDTYVYIRAQVAINGERPVFPRDAEDSPLCTTALRALVERCWSSNPLERPPSADIVKRLTLMIKQLEDVGDGAARLPQ